MTNENNSISKTSIIVSTIFSSLNLIIVAFYAYFSILALPIALDPNPGAEGLGLAVAIILMIILLIPMTIFGLISAITASRYNKLTYGSKWAKTLMVFNISAICAAVLIFAIILLTL